MDLGKIEVLKVQVLKGRKVLREVVYFILLSQIGILFFNVYSLYVRNNGTLPLYSLLNMNVSYGLLIVLLIFMYKGVNWIRFLVVFELFFVGFILVKYSLLLAVYHFIIAIYLAFNRNINNYYKCVSILDNIRFGEVELMKYHIAISFAGEDRKYAEKLVRYWENNGLKVFYDKNEEANLLGKNLYQHFQKVYKDLSLYSVILVSNNYLRKPWTRHELEQVQARDFQDVEKRYILMLKLEEVDVPGINSTRGFLNVNKKNVEETAEVVYNLVNDTIVCESIILMD